MPDAIKVLGVYSLHKETETGIGGGAKQYSQATYWFVRRLNDDDYEVQPLNASNIPSGIRKIISKGEFTYNYALEPDYYEKKTLPFLDSLKAKLDKGEEYLEAGNLEKAEREFCKAILIDAENARANIGLGSVYCLKKDHKKLKQVLDRLLNIDDVFNEEQRHRFNEFGMNLRRQKYFAESILYYQKALQVNASDERLLFNIARAYYDMGDIDTCMKRLSDALLLAPNFMEAQSFLAHCGKLAPNGANEIGMDKA
jgi:tetratricopeptide (TPR) repeat protein